MSEADTWRPLQVRVRRGPGGEQGTLRAFPGPVGIWLSVLACPEVFSQPPKTVNSDTSLLLPAPCDLFLLKTTLTADTDSEEDEDFLRDEWSAQGPSSSKLTSSLLCGMVAKNSKPAAGPKLTKRGLAAPRTLKPKPATSRKQPFCLLLREAEARSSFSDSSEDSFDQGY